jgi:hypothetical protein
VSVTHRPADGRVCRGFFRNNSDASRIDIRLTLEQGDCRLYVKENLPSLRAGK